MLATPTAGGRRPGHGAEQQRRGHAERRDRSAAPRAARRAPPAAGGCACAPCARRRRARVGVERVGRGGGERDAEQHQRREAQGRRALRRHPEDRQPREQHEREQPRLGEIRVDAKRCESRVRHAPTPGGSDRGAGLRWKEGQDGYHTPPPGSSAARPRGPRGRKPLPSRGCGPPPALRDARTRSGSCSPRRCSTPGGAWRSRTAAIRSPSTCCSSSRPFGLLPADRALRDAGPRFRTPRLVAARAAPGSGTGSTSTG